MSKNNNKFEHFKKKGVDAYSNIRSVYGKEGEQLLDDVMNAFSKALAVTKEELQNAADSKAVHKLNEKWQSVLDKVMENDTVNEMIENISDAIMSIFPEDKEETEISTPTSSKCACTHNECKGDCGDNCKCKKDHCSKNTCQRMKNHACLDNNNKCNKCKDSHNNIVIDNESDTTIKGDSPSTYLIRQKHQNYINDLANTIRTSHSPLPTALTRLFKQARKSYKEQNRYDKIVLSDVEKNFLTDMLNILFKALDAKFQMDSHSSIDDNDEYDDYKLPVFVENDTKTESEFIPSNFNDHTEYWFSGIDGVQVEGIGIRVQFDKYPSEIRQRLVRNSDNGRLLELLAIFTSFKKEDITFINHTNEEGEIFFFIQTNDACNMSDEFEGLSEY